MGSGSFCIRCLSVWSGEEGDVAVIYGVRVLAVTTGTRLRTLPISKETCFCAGRQVSLVYSWLRARMALTTWLKCRLLTGTESPLRRISCMFW